MFRRRSLRTAQITYGDPNGVKIIDLGASRAIGDTVYSVDMIQIRPHVGRPLPMRILSATAPVDSCHPPSEAAAAISASVGPRPKSC